MVVKNIILVQELIGDSNMRSGKALKTGSLRRKYNTSKKRKKKKSSVRRTMKGYGRVSRITRKVK